MSLLTILLLQGCDDASPEAEAEAVQASQLSTALVERASYRPSAEISGSAEPIRSVRLGFDVPGRLKELTVRRGETVIEGQALAVLDGRVAGSQYSQASAAVAAADAALAAAEDALARLDQLKESVSAQQRVQAEAQFKAARAQRDQAVAAQQAAGTSLRLHTLVAPISGIVTEAPDNPGALVGAGTPLFVIEDLSALRIKGSAPDDLSGGWLSDGLSATVRSGISEETAQAVVERVIPSLDPATRRLPVEVRIDTPPSWLRAHAFVRAEVTAAQDVPAFSVPSGAIVARPDFSVLRLKSPQETKGVERIPVTVVKEDGERTLVLGDLKEGDIVAVNPPLDLGASSAGGH